MKNHKEVPALTTGNIFGKIVRNTIKFEVVDTGGLFIFRTTKGCSVYQSWLSQKLGNPIKVHAITYLRKGLFLIPIWKKVPNWQMAYYKKYHVDLASESIYSFRNEWYRACYMQVDDIDHAIRQQQYVLSYYDQFGKAFMDEIFNPKSVADILKHINDRKQSLMSIRNKAQHTLDSYRRSLESIIDNSPLFSKNDKSNKETILKTIRGISEKCRSYDLCFRPIYRPVHKAALSLECALKYIEVDHLKTAKIRIESALRNLTYPDPV